MLLYSLLTRQIDTDQVTLCPALVIKDQSIGVADKADQMDGMDGILGIGPCDLTQGQSTQARRLFMRLIHPQAPWLPTLRTRAALRPSPTTCSSRASFRMSEFFPFSLLNSLTNYSTQECIGICYEPTTASSNNNNAPNGCLSFGGPDSSKYVRPIRRHAVLTRTRCTGKLNYVPITKTSPACQYWGIDQSIEYCGEEIMVKSAGIVDSEYSSIRPKSLSELFLQPERPS